MKPKGAEPSPDLHALDPRKRRHSARWRLLAVIRSFDALEFLLSPESDELPQIWATHRTALLARS